MGGAVKKAAPFVGAVVGGFAGFIVGGPSGALRGAALGYSLGSSARGAGRPDFGGGGAVGNVPDTGQLATAVGEEAWVPKQYGNRRCGSVLIATDLMNANHQIVRETGEFATSVYVLGEAPWTRINQMYYNNIKIFNDNATINFGEIYSFENSVFTEDLKNLEVQFVQGVSPTSTTNQTLPTMLSRVTYGYDGTGFSSGDRWFQDTDVGKGICYMVVRIKRDKNALLRETAPAFTIDAQTKQVRNILKEGSPLEYSTNPALIALDQLRNSSTGAFGLGLNDDEIDFDKFAEFAHYCNNPGIYKDSSATPTTRSTGSIFIPFADREKFGDNGDVTFGNDQNTRYTYTSKIVSGTTVELRGFNANVSGTNGNINYVPPKLELNGQFNQGSSIRGILEQISLATGALFADENGIVTVKVDKFEAGTNNTIISEDNIVGSISRTEPTTSSTPNVMNVKFWDEKGIETIEVVEFSNVIKNAEGRKEADLTLRMVSNAAIARELGKRALYQLRQATFNFSLNNTGYGLDTYGVSEVKDLFQTRQSNTSSTIDNSTGLNIFTSSTNTFRSRIRIFEIQKARINQTANAAPVRVSAKTYTDDIYLVNPSGMSIVGATKLSDAPGVFNIPRPLDCAAQVIDPDARTARITWDDITAYNAEIEFKVAGQPESTYVTAGKSFSSPAEITITGASDYRYDISVRYVAPDGVGVGPRCEIENFNIGAPGEFVQNGFLKTGDVLRAANDYVHVAYANDANGNGIRNTWNAAYEQQGINHSGNSSVPASLIYSPIGKRNHRSDIYIPATFSSGSNSAHTERFTWNAGGLLANPSFTTEPTNSSFSITIPNTANTGEPTVRETIQCWTRGPGNELRPLPEAIGGEDELDIPGSSGWGVRYKGRNLVSAAFDSQFGNRTGTFNTGLGSLGGINSQNPLSILGAASTTLSWRPSGSGVRFNKGSPLPELEHISIHTEDLGNGRTKVYVWNYRGLPLETFTIYRAPRADYPSTIPSWGRSNRVSQRIGENAREFWRIRNPQQNVLANTYTETETVRAGYTFNTNIGDTSTLLFPQTTDFPTATNAPGSALHFALRVNANSWRAPLFTTTAPNTTVSLTIDGQSDPIFSIEQRNARYDKRANSAETNSNTLTVDNITANEFLNIVKANGNVRIAGTEITYLSVTHNATTNIATFILNTTHTWADNAQVFIDVNRFWGNSNAWSSWENFYNRNALSTSPWAIRQNETLDDVQNHLLSTNTIDFTKTGIDPDFGIMYFDLTYNNTNDPGYDVARLLNSDKNSVVRLRVNNQIVATLDMFWMHQSSSAKFLPSYGFDLDAQDGQSGASVNDISTTSFLDTRHWQLVAPIEFTGITIFGDVINGPSFGKARLLSLTSEDLLDEIKAFFANQVNITDANVILQETGSNRTITVGYDDNFSLAAGTSIATSGVKFNSPVKVANTGVTGDITNTYVAGTITGNPTVLDITLPTGQTLTTGNLPSGANVKQINQVIADRINTLTESTGWTATEVTYPEDDSVTEINSNMPTRMISVVDITYPTTSGINNINDANVAVRGIGFEAPYASHNTPSNNLGFSLWRTKRYNQEEAKVAFRLFTDAFSTDTQSVNNLDPVRIEGQFADNLNYVGIANAIRDRLISYFNNTTFTKRIGVNIPNVVDNTANAVININYSTTEAIDTRFIIGSAHRITDNWEGDGISSLYVYDNNTGISDSTIIRNAGNFNTSDITVLTTNGTAGTETSTGSGGQYTQITVAIPNGLSRTTTFNNNGGSTAAIMTSLRISVSSLLSSYGYTSTLDTIGRTWTFTKNTPGPSIGSLPFRIYVNDRPNPNGPVATGTNARTLVFNGGKDTGTGVPPSPPDQFSATEVAAGGTGETFGLTINAQPIFVNQHLINGVTTRGYSTTNNQTAAQVAPIIRDAVENAQSTAVKALTSYTISNFSITGNPTTTETAGSSTLIVQFADGPEWSRGQVLNAGSLTIGSTSVAYTNATYNYTTRQITFTVPSATLWNMTDTVSINAGTQLAIDWGIQDDIRMTWNFSNSANNHVNGIEAVNTAGRLGSRLGGGLLDLDDLTGTTVTFEDHTNSVLHEEDYRTMYEVGTSNGPNGWTQPTFATLFDNIDGLIDSSNFAIANNTTDNQVTITGIGTNRNWNGLYELRMVDLPNAQRPDIAGRTYWDLQNRFKSSSIRTLTDNFFVIREGGPLATYYGIRSVDNEMFNADDYIKSNFCWIPLNPTNTPLTTYNPQYRVDGTKDMDFSFIGTPSGIGFSAIPSSNIIDVRTASYQELAGFEIIPPPVTPLNGSQAYFVNNAFHVALPITTHSTVSGSTYTLNSGIVNLLQNGSRVYIDEDSNINLRVNVGGTPYTTASVLPNRIYVYNSTTRLFELLP